MLLFLANTAYKMTYIKNIGLPNFNGKTKVKVFC